jgi:hypothetical protein
VKPPKKDAPGHLHTLPSGRKVIVAGETAPNSTAAEIAFFANYAEYAKTLRAWLVAYGIGGPVLLITNKELLQALKLSPYRNHIVDLFLLGVALQVLLAFINKWCAWHMYVGEYEPSFQSSRRYKFWSWLNERSWIDMLVDGGSLFAFAVSTCLVVHVFS